MRFPFRFELTYLSVKVVLELVVEPGNVLAEGLELRDDQLVAEDLGQEGQVAGEDVAELVKVQTARRVPPF